MTYSQSGNATTNNEHTFICVLESVRALSLLENELSVLLGEVDTCG